MIMDDFTKWLFLKGKVRKAYGNWLISDYKTILDDDCNDIIIHVVDDNNTTVMKINFDKRYYPEEDVVYFAEELQDFLGINRMDIGHRTRLR